MHKTILVALLVMTVSPALGAPIDARQQGVSDPALLRYRRDSEAASVQPPSGGETVPLYRLRNETSGHHFYTANAAEKDALVTSQAWVLEGIAGYVLERPAAGTVALFRLSRQVSNGGSEHFYTTRAQEARLAGDAMGYRDEGIACYVAATQLPGTVALFRLYLPLTERGHLPGVEGHFYTTDAAERDRAVAFGYSDEGTEGFVWQAAVAIGAGITAEIAKVPDGPPPADRVLGVKVAATVATRIRGQLRCSVPTDSPPTVLAAPNLPFEVRDYGSGVTNDDGTFSISAMLALTSVHLKLIYDGRIAGPPEDVSSRLQVMDEGHGTRSDEIDREGTLADGVVDLGVVDLESTDCELWRIGAKVLKDYHVVRNASPPAGQLRIKRWSGVLVGGEHTFYDYVVVPTDFLTEERNPSSREATLFHEFAHSVRHVADGSEAHWNGDNFRWAYARSHSDEVTNVQYAFNEGWADYWSMARTTPVARRGTARHWSHYAAGYRDWNENLVANRLLDLAVPPPGAAWAGVGDLAMIEVLEQNPGAIHSLHEFEVKLAARQSAPAPPDPASCPPDYADDGATCRRDVSVTAKPSHGRGAGAVPSGCGAGEERDGALCYPACKAGYSGAGPVCWQQCPDSYSDDGATCRRDAHIIGADNSRCPAYDKCGLTLSRGCSVCPEGYANDGCTCRIDVSIFAKASYTRGAGSPMRCAAGQQADAGLCYTPCPAGFHGVGPVCWGSCPEWYDDHGGTCYRGASILVKF